MRSTLTLSVFVTSVFLAAAMAPGSMADDACGIIGVVLRTYCIADAKETPAVTLAALACALVVQARAFASVYLVTPMAMWHAWHALIH